MRLIDADALKANCDIKVGDTTIGRRDYVMFHEIDNAPTIDAVSEWIPCSERLPSEQGQYLVTFPLCNGDPWVYVLSFCKDKFYETDDEWGDVDYDDVTAWMPLPKPWKGASDERNENTNRRRGPAFCRY